MPQDASERKIADRAFALLTETPPHRMHTVTIANLLNRGQPSTKAISSSEVFRACYDDERFAKRKVGILTEYRLAGRKTNDEDDGEDE